MVVLLSFIVNLYHDGVCHANYFQYVNFDCKVIVSFDDMSFKELLVPLEEHRGYDIMEIIAEELHPKKLTENPNPNLQGRFLLEVKNPNYEQSGIRFESPQQLKHMIANYGVQHGYQLWYMHDHNKLLVFCDRDVSEGKYDALKGLIQAVADWLPNAEHNSVPGTFMLISRRGGVGYSLRGFFGLLLQHQWRQSFCKKIEEIKMLDEKAHKWLVERNPNSWCRAYFEMDICAFENKDSITSSVIRQMKFNKKIQRYMHMKMNLDLGVMNGILKGGQEKGELDIQLKIRTMHMPPSTATPSSSNTMSLPSTPSSLNTMPPSPTPSSSNTIPPPPTPPGSNIMPSSPTTSDRPIKSSASSNKDGSRGGFSSRGGYRGGASKRGRCFISLQGLRDESDEEHQFEMDMEAVYEIKAEQIASEYEQVRIRKLLEDSDEDDQFWEDCAREFDHVEEPTDDKGLLEDVSTGKQPMIEDDSLQVGADLPTQESKVKANPKPTRSKKSKQAQHPY
nr:calcium/proton exchanger [Tanacetum cinerariifolium]